MKRLLLLALAFCLLLSLSACDLAVSSEKPSVSVADPTAPTPSRNYETEESTEVESTEETTDPLDELYVPGNSYAQVYRTESGTVWAMVVMEFINVSDTPLSFDYADIDLIGKDNKVFQTIETVSFLPQIIAPGETGYYCEVVPLDVAEEISLTPRLSKDFRGIHPVEEAAAFYEVSNHTLSDSLYGGLELQLTVKNTTNTTGELVCVSAILLNASEIPVGFISGYLDSSLAAGASQEVNFESFMLPPDLSAADITDMIIFAYPVF